MIFKARHQSLLFGVFTLACAPTRNPPPTVPTPASVPPTSQAPTSAAPSVGEWSFKYQSGTAAYRIARSATIIRSDTGGHSELSTNTSHELVTIDSTEQGNSFIATVDTFATTTQGLIGPVQAVQLPIQMSGSLTSGGLTLSNQTTGAKCSPVQSVLFTDLYNLLVPFPERLSAGTSWRDSVEIQGCPAGVATHSHTIRSFAVTGEVMYEGRPVLMIQRADTTRAQGDGGLSQHRISIDAHGTGTAVYYLDVPTGRIAHLTVNQTLMLGISTSSRQYQLQQDSKQEFGSVR